MRGMRMRFAALATLIAFAINSGIVGGVRGETAAKPPESRAAADERTSGSVAMAIAALEATDTGSSAGTLVSRGAPQGYLRFHAPLYAPGQCAYLSLSLQAEAARSAQYLPPPTVE